MIILKPYDKEWATIFEELKTIYYSLFSNDIMGIEHVGSTAIPGLYAKPILDIDIIIENKSKLESIISKLENIGYVFRGDLGIKNRYAFSPSTEYTPITAINKRWMKHNLYVCISNSISLQNHLLLKDYLLKNDAAVNEYSKIKQELIEKYPNDIDNYIKYKTPFITDILEKQGVDKNALHQIKKANGYDQ